jgi:catechol 2,3-dioxygenase-like lactoylglutathione lyase family enzyme
VSIHARFARPTDRLDEIADLYRRGLDLEVVAEFRDHDGYEGIVLGGPDLGWEIEFTREEGVPAAGAPSPEHLLVVYEPDPGHWEAACERMLAAGFASVTSANPYWNVAGRTFKDPDGYRVVLQNAVAPGARA